MHVLALISALALCPDGTVSMSASAQTSAVPGESVPITVTFTNCTEWPEFDLLLAVDIEGDGDFDFQVLTFALPGETVTETFLYTADVADADKTGRVEWVAHADAWFLGYEGSINGADIQISGRGQVRH